MTREIKFRAWDKKGKMMWVPGEAAFYVGSQNGLAYNGHRDVYEDFDLMQYTGLKDKNGTEIYEGDVLKEVVDFDNGYRGAHIENNLQVFFDRGAFMYVNVKEGLENGWYQDLRTLSMSNEITLEVIGNIYENSDLIEKP